MQILCPLLLQPVLGLPFTRQALAKSARSDDDLISGTDFLSIFIGASIPRSRSVNRSRNVNKYLDSVTSEESFAEETTAFFTRTAPKGSNLFPADPLGDSSSILQDSTHKGSKQDIVDEISTGDAGLSTTEADDTDVLNNEAQKSLLPSMSSSGLNVQTIGVEPIAASSITSSKRIEYIPQSSADKVVDFESDTEKDESIVSSLPSSNVAASSDNTSSDTFGLHEMSTFPINNNSTTTEVEILSDKLSDYSDISESPVENKTFDTNPISSKEDESTADWSNLDTTEAGGTENQTHKVVSVRVSSSVALGKTQQNSKIDHDNKRIFNTFLDSFSHDINKEARGSSAEGASLVTEEQPAATAIQRSQFSVEEASPSSSIISGHQESSSNSQSRQSAFPIPGAIESPLDPQSSPVSYHTSVSTATSGSRVQFYSEPPSHHRTASSVAETVQRTVVAQQPQHQGYGQVKSALQAASDNSKQVQNNYQTSSPRRNVNVHTQTAGQQVQGETSRTHKSYSTHQEPPERNYELPEQNYGSPERSYAAPEHNYEIDEAVNVMTNGRVHGVQFPAVTTPVDTTLRELNSHPGQSRDPNSKFGYVVEGRNFRKYQVEERTPDGFIVGEYGVVSHDDGSLRGVRYTADGTINPRLIYDALVKFLSL